MKQISPNLYELLESDDPVALRRIEKALLSGDASNETVDAVLSALIWRRCTAGPNGVLGAVINHECAERIKVLSEHLDRIGASDAAQAMRDLRERIPLEDEHFKYGIIDWVESNPDFVKHAARLNDRIDDVAPKVWSFMQEHQKALPDFPIPEKRQGLFDGLFGR